MRWRSNPDVYRYFFNRKPVTMTGHLKWFEMYLSDETRLDFLVSERLTQKKLGVVGLQNMTSDSADIAYMIGEKSEQRKGYGAEAVATMTRFVFERFPVKEVRAIVASDNLASQRMIATVGYSDRYHIYTVERDEFSDA